MTALRTEELNLAEDTQICIKEELLEYFPSDIKLERKSEDYIEWDIKKEDIGNTTELSNNCNNDKNSNYDEMPNCDSFNYKTEQKSYLGTHEMTQMKEVETFDCPKREENLSDHCSLSQHKEIRHSLKEQKGERIHKYACGKCNYETNYKSNLIRHKLVHSGSDEYVGNDLLNNRCYTNGTICLIKNISRVHATIYTCSMCGYETPYRGNIKRHQLKHMKPSEKERFVCNVCKVSFTHKYHLTKHVKCRHGSGSNQDSTGNISLNCNQTNNNDASSISRKYTCNKCEYKSTQKSNLYRHQETHKKPHEKIKFICYRCKKSYVNKANLICHIQFVHGSVSDSNGIGNVSSDLIHSCNQCSFRTIKKGALISHLYKHIKLDTVLQMYICNECGFQTENRKDTKEHLNSHYLMESFKVYECELCLFQAFSKPSLKSHLKTKQHLLRMEKERQ